MQLGKEGAYVVCEHGGKAMVENLVSCVRKPEKEATGDREQGSLIPSPTPQGEAWYSQFAPCVKLPQVFRTIAK